LLDFIESLVGLISKPINQPDMVARIDFELLEVIYFQDQ
jgi:hypothetical protein